MEPFFGGGPGPSRGKCNFLEGPVNTTTSERDVAFRRRPDAAPHRPAAGPMSKRSRYDVNYRYVADVVLTSARRRRVYWAVNFKKGTPLWNFVINSGLRKFRHRSSKRVINFARERWTLTA